MMQGKHITNLEGREMLERELAAATTPEQIGRAQRRLAAHPRELASIEQEAGPFVYGPPKATRTRTTGELTAIGIVGLYERIG